MAFVLACLLSVVKKFLPGDGKEVEKASLLSPAILFAMKTKHKPFNRLFVFLIRGYRALLSPLMRPHCRFHPSCSEYGLHAFSRFVFFKAFWLTIKRVSKCHPFSRGGFDPLPR